MSVEQIINDPASLTRLGKLALAFDREAQRWLAEGDNHQADISREAAERIRMRLVALLDLTADDVAVEPAPAVEPEPPCQLVPFVEWLRGRIGRYLPWVPAETWQRVGYALLWDRRP